MRRIIATAIWGLLFWFFLNALVFVVGGLIVRVTVTSEEVAGQWGCFLVQTSLLYGSIPAILFTAWAGVSARLPGTKELT